MCLEYSSWVHARRGKEEEASREAGSESAAPQAVERARAADLPQHGAGRGRGELAPGQVDGHGPRFALLCIINHY